MLLTEKGGICPRAKLYHFSFWRRWPWPIHHFHWSFVLLLRWLQLRQIHEIHRYPVIETLVD